MRAYSNQNIVEVPANDTNHCRQCKDRLGKRYIIENSRFYCNIDCLSRYLSYKLQCDNYKIRYHDTMVNILYTTIGIVLLILIIRSY